MRLIPRFYLSTAILVMILTGVTLGLNVMPTKARLTSTLTICRHPGGPSNIEGKRVTPTPAIYQTTSYQIDGFAFGFPFTIAESKTPNLLESRRIFFGALALNAVIGSGMLALSVFVELWIQRKRPTPAFAFGSAKPSDV